MFCCGTGTDQSEQPGNIKNFRRFAPSSPDRQPVRSTGNLQQVVIVHELDQGANREFVEQLVRRSIPNGGADRLKWVRVSLMVGRRKGETWTRQQEVI